MNIGEYLHQCIDQAIDEHALMVERLIKNRCTNCKYAKTCNPKRFVGGIEMRRENEHCNNTLYYSETFKIYSETYKIRFVCHKFSLRKRPVAWNETRIYKIAQTIKEK